MVQKLIVCISIVICLVQSSAWAQSLRDSHGTDFWLALPPNDHSSGGSDAAILSLHVNCDGPTDVTITATARDGTVDTQTTRVPGAAVWEFRFNALPYELRGVTSPNGSSNDGEKSMPAAIHITTSEDVSVYAVMRDDSTSDAWLVLPTDALGTSYRVSTYASSATVDTTIIFGLPLVRFTAIYASQFVIVATEDNTDITIDLSVSRSSVANGAQRSIRLDRGRSYLLQARVTDTRQNDDLTGTRIVATKPIVVLGAHTRAQVPVLKDNASRDCLVEQLPSVDTWGKHIIVPPLQIPNDYLSTSASDVTQCRILAAEDSTLVQINGQEPSRIDAGKFLDTALVSALDVVATKPVLVTIVDRTANRVDGSRRSGDPSLILMPPIEQYLSTYRVVNVEPRLTGTAFYTQHQITCVVPMNGVASLTLDGVPSAPATAIAGTSFGYVHYRVAAGPHQVRSDSSFGIFVYGYGPAESYGYTGGMAFQRLYVPSVVLKVLDVVGYPGDTDTMFVVVDSISNVVDLRLSGVNQLAASITVDLSTFIPDTSTVADPVTLGGVVPFVRSFDSLSVGDTVETVIGRHVLGSDTLTTSSVKDVLWTTGAGDTVDVRTIIVDGRVITLGICLEQRPRLFDPSVAVPARVKHYYDILGRDAGTTIDGLSPGLYFVR